MYIGGPYRLGTHQTVSYTGTAGVISNATSAQTKVVRIVLTSAGYIAFGTAPTATTSDYYMPANVPEYFIINGAQKVSAVQASAGGALHVTEMDR